MITMLYGMSQRVKEMVLLTVGLALMSGVGFAQTALASATAPKGLVLLLDENNDWRCQGILVQHGVVLTYTFCTRGTYGGGECDCGCF